MRFYDTRDEFLSDFIYDHREFETWDRPLLYSSLVRMNPGIQESIRDESKYPDFATADDVIDALISLNPEMSSAPRRDIAFWLSTQFPDLNDAWNFDSYLARPEDESPEQSAFANWIGRTPELPLDKYESGKKILDLEKSAPQTKLGAFVDQFVGRGVRDWTPYASEAMDSVELAKIANSYRKFLRDESDENLTDEEIVDLNLYMKRMERESAHGWASQSGAALRQSLLFAGEFAAYAALQALTVFSPVPGDEVAVGTLGARSIASRVLRSEAKAKLADQLVRRGAMRGGKIVKRATAGRMFNAALKDSATEAIQEVLGVGAEKGVLASVKRGAARTIATQGVNLGNALVMTAGKELAIGGATLAATGEFDTRRSQQMQLEDMLESVKVDDGAYRIASYFDGAIENYSEFVGDELLGAAFGRLGAAALDSKTAKAFGASIRAAAESAEGAAAKSTTSRIARSLLVANAAYRNGKGIFAVGERLADIGYNGLLQEFAEERVGDIIRGVTGLEGDEELSALARGWDNAFNKTSDEWWSEALVLAVPLAGAHAVSGGLGKLSEHAAGYAGARRLMGHLLGYESDLRKLDSNVELRAPATKEEEAAVASYRDQWKTRLAALVESGTSVDEAKAMLERVESGKMDGGILDRVRAEKAAADKLADWISEPFDSTKPVVELKPVPAEAVPAQTEEDRARGWAAGTLGTFESDDQVREFIERGLVSGTKQRRSQGLVIDLANRLLEWATMHRFVAAGNRTYGEGRGFEPTPELVQARQGAVDVIGFARRTYEKAVRENLSRLGLWNADYASLDAGRKEAYDLALHEAAHSASAQSMVMVRNISHLVQYRANLSDAEYADLAGEAGLDPTPENVERLKKAHADVEDMLGGKLSGLLYRDTATGRIHLKPEGRRLFDEDMEKSAAAGAEAPVRVSDAQLRLQALEWRGVDTRRRNLEDEQARLDKAKAAAEAAGVSGVRHLRLSGDLPAAAALFRSAADANSDPTTASLLRIAAAELDDLYFRRGFSFTGMQFNSADFEQANKPADEADTLAVRTLRKLLNPGFDDADFQRLLMDHGYSNTEQGVSEFRSFLTRMSTVLRERMDRSNLRAGDVVVDSSVEGSPAYRVAEVNADGTYRVALVDERTGEFETKKDSDGNPVLGADGRPQLRGEVVSAGRGRFVRKTAVERVSFMKSHVLVDGTAAQFEAAGLQGPSLEDRRAGVGVVKRVYEKDANGKPTKRLDPEKSTYAIRLSGTTSSDGRTLALSFDEATFAEETVEAALKQAAGTVPAADGSGLRVSPGFLAAADELRERLTALGPRASQSQKRLLDALSAPDPNVRARYLFELQGKVQLYGNFGFDKMVDALGRVDSFILRDEAMTFIGETNEDGKNPVLESLAKMYRSSLGDAAYAALAYRADAKPASGSPGRAGDGQPPSAFADAVRVAEKSHEEAVRSGRISDIRRTHKALAEARRAAGMSSFGATGTSATRASAYEVQMREQLRLAGIALASAKIAGDPGRASELRKLRDQLRASLAKAESLRKAGGALEDARKAAAKRTGYGTDEYETTRSAFTDLLFPELLRSGALHEADVEALKSRSSGYADARKKLADVLSRPFMFFSVGKMEGDSPDVAEAIVDQVFGPMRYAAGALPAMPEPIGDRTGMSDEQVAEAERDFEREFSMFELSQQAVNQALDGDAREAEAAGRLSNQISRAVLAERMGPWYAMHLDRMRSSANVRGGAAFGMRLASAGGAKRIAEAAKKSDALAATSPIWNAASWAAFQSADTSKWATWEKDFHDVAKRMSYEAAKAMWPAWFGRRFQELLKADIVDGVCRVGPDGRLVLDKMRGHTSLEGGASDGQTGTIVSTIQVHVANRVRTEAGLATLVDELGKLFGYRARAIGSPRLSKDAFARALRTASGAREALRRMPRSAWVMQPDQKTPVATENPLNKGAREVTSMARSLTYFGWLARSAYAENGLERFLPWSPATAGEKRDLLNGSASLYDAAERAAAGAALTESEIENAAAEYDRVMRAGEAASFFLKNLYIALDKVAKEAGAGESYDYEKVRAAAYSAVAGARVRPTQDALLRGDSHENNAGIAVAHLGSLAKESSRSTGLGSKPLQMHQRHMAYFDLAEEARDAGILYSGSGSGIAMIDLEANAWMGSLLFERVDGSRDGYGKESPSRADGTSKRRGYRRGPDDQSPQEQYLAMLMAIRFGRRGPGGFYAFPIPMADKKRLYSILLDSTAVEAEAAKVVAEFPSLKDPKGGYRLDALLTAMDRLMAPIVSRVDSFGPKAAEELSTSLKAMVKRLRLLSTSGDVLPIVEDGMRSTYRAFVAEEMYLEAGTGAEATRIELPKKADPFDGGAYALRRMLDKLDRSRGRKAGTTHSAKLQETGSALYKGNLTSGDAVLRTEEILSNFGLPQLNPIQAAVSRMAAGAGVDMWTTPGSEKVYDKSPGAWPVEERREAVELPDGTKATLVAKGRVLTHWTASTLEVANLVRQAAPSAKDTTVSVPYNVSQGTESQRDAAKLLFDLDLLRAELSGGLYSVDAVLAKAADRAKSRDDYVGGMLERGMSVRDPHALADMVPSLLSSAGAGFSSSAPTISAQLVPSGEVLGEGGKWFRNPFLSPPGERDGKSTAGMAMVNDVAPGARYLWAVDPKDLAEVKDAIVRLARDPKSKEAREVLRGKVRDYFLQEPTGRESVEDLVLDDFSFDEDAVREIGGKTYILGTGGIGYRIPGGKDGMAAGFFRLTLPATLDIGTDGRVVAGRENYASISGRSAGQRGEDFDGDMFYFKLAQRGTADIDGLRTRAKAALAAGDAKAVADLLKETDRAANAAHVRAVRGMTPAQANATIDKTIADRVVALDGRTVGDHATAGTKFAAGSPYLKSGRGLAAADAKDDAGLKGVAVSAADAVSVQSLYGVMPKAASEDESAYRARLEILQRTLTNVVNIALDVVNEPRAGALNLSPRTLPLFVAFVSRERIDASAERDPAKAGDPQAKGTVARAIQRWVEFSGSVEFAAYETFAETMPAFELDKLLESEKEFDEAIGRTIGQMRKVSSAMAAEGVPVDAARWERSPDKARLNRVWAYAKEAKLYHRRGRISKAADRGFATVFDVARMRKDLSIERADAAGFAQSAPFRRAEVAVARAEATLRAAFGDEATDLVLALDPKFRSVFDEALDGILSDRAKRAVADAHAEVLAPYAPESRAKVAQAVVEKLIADPRMVDNAFANSLAAESGRSGQTRIKHVAPRTPPMIARKAADEFWTRLSSFGPIEVSIDGAAVQVPVAAVAPLVAIQQIEEHGISPSRFKGGIYHFLPASFQTETAKQFEKAEEKLSEGPSAAPAPAPAPETGLTYLSFLSRLPASLRDEMRATVDSMGPDTAAMLLAETLGESRIREELQIARNIANERDDAAELNLELDRLEAELLGAKPEEASPLPETRTLRRLIDAVPKPFYRRKLAEYAAEMGWDLDSADSATARFDEALESVRIENLGNETVDADLTTVRSAVLGGEGQGTSATRRAEIDAGKRTLTELYLGLAARKNDAADADRMMRPIAERLDSDGAAARAAARAEVLRDLATMLSRNSGAKYTGIASRVNDLIGRLAAMDSVLAGTTAAAPAPAAPKQGILPLEGGGVRPGTSATVAAMEIPSDKLVTDPNEIAGAGPDNPLSLSDKVVEDRMLAAQGLPVRELMEDRGFAAAVGAFRGWLDDGKLAPQAAGIAALVAERHFAQAHEALSKAGLPEELENRVRRALFDAEEHAAWSHRDFADLGFDPVAEPAAGALDPVGEDDVDFRQIDGGTTSTTQTMDWVVRNHLATLAAYGGTQRVHYLMRDTAYFVNAENKKLGHVLTRERAVFQEDAKGTFFRKSVDAKEIDAKTGLPKKEYLRGLLNRVVRGDSRVALSEKDRNLLTRVWAALDAMIEGSDKAVYGGKPKFVVDETGKKTFTYSETTGVDENGVPNGDVESVDRILRDFEASELYAKYRANGRTAADLDLRALAGRISNEYAGFRERLNAQAAYLVGGRDYLDKVSGYVPHQYANPGFDTVKRRDARAEVERTAEAVGRRSGERSELPAEAFDASDKSAKRDQLNEQRALIAKLAEERDLLTGYDNARQEVERSQSDDLRAANARILRLAREIEYEKAEKRRENAEEAAAPHELAMRMARSAMDEKLARKEAGLAADARKAALEYEMPKATADLIAGLKHTVRNYAVREWTERVEERSYDTYFDAYVGSKGRLARRAVDPFERLDQYVSEVTSVMQAQLLTQLSMLVPDQNGNLFAVGVPDLDRLATQSGDRRRLVNESVVAAQVEFISRQHGIKDVPGETAFHRLKWLVDNGYAFGKGGLKSEYVKLRSPYASMSEIYVQKGRASALFQKIMGVDPQLLFRLRPGGAQRDLVRILGDFVMLTKHMAVSWSAFFVFAGVEGMIAQGGLRHNALYHPIQSVKKLVDMRRKIRRGDAELDQTIYDLHRAGMDLSEHNLTDGATSVVDRWASGIAERFARATGYDRLGATAKLGFNFLSGRWLSQKIMGDFFPMMKMWGAMEMIENARKHMPGVPLARIRRALAPSVNDAFGGQMFVDYPALTPKMLKILNLSMFAPNWCCPLDSQALTKTGWKNYDEVEVGDEILIFDNETGKTRWGPVRDKFVDEAYEGDMVHVRNYGHDLRMTPEHTCVVTNRGGTERRVRKARTLSTNDGIPRCAAHSELPVEETVPDRLVVLAGWLVTDGTIKRKKHVRADGTETEYRYGRVVQSKPATVKILKDLGLSFYVGKLKDTNFHANYAPHTFSVPVAEYKELESLGVVDGKLSWGFLSRLTERQLRLLADTMMLGDGTGQNRFCGEESEIFWMTLINVLLGKPVTFYEQRQEGQRCWRTRHVSTRTISCHRKETKPYSGGIWCPSVDTGFWVTQQDGVVFITGNTISAWNVAGGQLLTGARFGNFLTLEGERFVFGKNWPAMYLYVLLALPHALQAGILAAAKGFGGGDDPDDEWLAWNNEREKGGLFPSIDITPIVRMLPGYEGGRTKKRRQYVQFGKQSYEVIDGWLKDPWKTFLRKTSMPVKLVWEQVFGHSPGSPDFNLAFHKAGLAGVLSSPYEGSGYEKFARSRVGTALQKFVPLSFTKLATGDMDAWAVMGIAPASKGISETRAIQGMADILETYADADSFGRLKTSAAARANLEKSTWGYMIALQKNGNDPYAALKAARGMVMKRHYGDFFKAFERKDDAGMERAARSLLRLGGTSSSLALSLQAKFKTALRRKMTEEEKAAAVEAFEGQIPVFYREGTE